MIKAYVSKYEVEVIVYYMNFLRFRRESDPELESLYSETTMNEGIGIWLKRRHKFDIVFDSGVF